MTEMETAEHQRLLREQQNTTLGLLRLPPEIRSQIYELSLLQNKIISTFSGEAFELCEHCQREAGHLHHRRLQSQDLCEWNLQYNHAFTSSSNYATLVNTSQVCRNLRVEVLKMFYANNAFQLRVHLSPQDDHLDQSISHTRWLHSRPAYVLHHLKSIILYFELPHTCQNLMRLAQRTRPTTVCDYGVKVHIDMKARKVSGFEGSWRRRPKAFGLWHCEMCWERLKRNLEVVQGDERFERMCESWRTGEWGAEDWVELVGFVVEGARKGTETIGEEENRGDGGGLRYDCSIGRR